MIDDLHTVLRLKRKHNVSEIVAGRRLFHLLLEKRRTDGQGNAPPSALNLNQDSLTYPYMHRLWWNGILFIHFSNDPLPEPGMTSSIST